MSHPPANQDNAADDGTFWRWYAHGMREAVSLPALMLMTAFVGFAGFARETGLPASHVMLMTLVVWALPAKFILIAAIQAGASLPTAFLAVTLSSARLMPMVVALVPEMRTKTTRKWVLLLLSHFVAITGWVIAMERFGSIPRRWRTTFFAGLACTLTASNVLLVGLVYWLAPVLPAPLLGALFFLTPVYFLCSVWGSARETSGRIAMLLGLIMGPVFFLLTPEFSLLATGLVAGTIAYWVGRVQRTRKVSS